MTVAAPACAVARNHREIPPRIAPPNARERAPRPVNEADGAWLAG